MLHIRRFEISREWSRRDMLGSLDGFEGRLDLRIMLVHDANLFRDRLNDYPPIDYDNNVHHSLIASNRSSVMRDQFKSQKRKNKLISSPNTISA